MTDVKKIKARKLKKNNSSDDIDVDINKGVVDDKKQSKSNNRVVKKKVKSRKIKMSFTAKEERKMDNQIEVENNISVAFMMFILVLCFIVGISLGYILYRIAINNSSAMFIVRNLLC